MILLVILTILVLFTLVAVTFVLVATQEYKTARADWKSQLYDDEFDEHLERVMLQVVRGSNIPTSRIGFHSLLEDMYGSDGVVDYINSMSTVFVTPDPFDGFGTDYGLGNGSFMFIDVPLSGPDRAPGAAGFDDDDDLTADNIEELGFGDDYKQINGYYNGRVITMLDGPMAGRSSRIHGYQVNLTDTAETFTTPVLPDLPAYCARILMQPFEGMFVDGGFWNAVNMPQGRNVFAINGRPYNGTGAGFNWEPDAGDPLAGRVNAADVPGGREWALLPFPAKLYVDPADPQFAAYMTHVCGQDGAPGFFDRDDDGNGITDFVSPGVPDIAELWAPGSDDLFQAAFDEDYDAPDYQNMLLAARMWNPRVPIDPDNPRWDVTHPSLVRPDLVRYWVTQYEAAGFDLTLPDVVAELMLRIYPRPLQIGDPTAGYGHPDFDGNPLLSLENLADDINGVDDGDGIPDSLERLYTDFDGDGFPDVVYDVDNDGDGRPDSVWADVGLPVQTLPDGRIVKPLAAIMVLDMDGRANLNAHGNPSHVAVDTSTTEGEVYIAQNTFTGPYAFTPLALGGTTDDTLIRPIGSGYSVGDINLAFTLQPPYLGSFPDYLAEFGTANTINEYRQLMHGRPALDLDGDGTADVPAIPGRYGEPHFYYLSGEHLIPISGGGNATTDWIARFQTAGGQVPMPGITSTGQLPEFGGAFPDPPGGWGWDDTEDTPDDLFDGDDNKPAAVGAAVGAAFVYHWSGNHYAEGYLYGHTIGMNGSPPDVDGNGGLLLDLRGMPFYSQQGEPTAATISGITRPESVDEHAELDLSQEAMRKAPTPGGYEPGTTQQVDQPFTPGELEYLLRYFDIDARSLPNRIGRLAPNLAFDNLRRGRTTTESWDYAGYNVSPTPEIRTAFGPTANNLTVHEMLAARLIDGLGYSVPITLAQGEIINDQLAGLLSPDLAAGLRLDLNRVFGNGLDDDGDGVVDDPDEAINIDSDGDGVADYTDPASLFAAGIFIDPAEKLERLWIGSAAEGASPSGILPFDNNNDGEFDARDLQVRQELARHLYVVMMMLKDTGFHHPAFESGLTGPTARPAPFGAPGDAITEHEELTARRIAQWAINVVDFRDRDSIMTPFEYDVRPFEDNTSSTFAWEVDGWIGTNPGPDFVFGTGDDFTSADDTAAPTNPRRLVWGSEQPDLLLTEAIVGHDRRVVDLATDTSSQDRAGGDGDFDQARIPQGWAFIEMYCCRNPGDPTGMRDLYAPNGQLNLGKMAPVDEDGDAYPVWRMAVSESRIDDADNDVYKRLYGDPTDATDPDFAPDTTTLQPEQMNLFDPADTIDIERIVWFAAQGPTNVAADGFKTIENNKIYYNRATTASNVLLSPGSYAVVGPRRDTVTTSTENVTVIGFEDATDPEPQRIRLGDSERDTVAPFAPLTPFQFDGGGVDATYPGYPTDLASSLPDIKTPLGIAVAGDRAGWTDGIGFSISEPLFSAGNYYPIPNSPTDTTDPHDGSLVWSDRYDADPALAGEQAYDQPMDSDGAASRPLFEDGILETGTTANYKTVFLQRLANPVWPWNPDFGQPGHEATLPVNPYITIDWMPLDLTVYNGEEDPPAIGDLPDGPLEHDPEDPDPDPADIRFATRERGYDDETDNVVPNSPRRGPGARRYNLWSPITTIPPRVTDVAGEYTYTAQGAHNFKYLMDHTLGYLNLPYQDIGGAGPLWYGPPPAPYAAAPYMDLWETSIPRHTGDPTRPFAWLTWNNRPYSSAMELLMVPSSSPQRLLYEHDVRRDDGTNEFTEQYVERRDTGTDALADVGPPFNHLLHLFLSSDTNDDALTDYDPNDPAEALSNFHRLFELVTVPSRMSGTEEMLDPVAFTGLVGVDFHPPFNRLSRYRDPGRINLNTIFDNGATLRALTNDFGNSTASNDDLWAKFNRSRRGYDVAATPDQIPRYDAAAASPTVFANPFRSFGSDYNVPLDDLRYRNLDSSGTGVRRQYVESSILRPDPDDENRPLFAPGTELDDTDPWVTYMDSQPYRNANENPYFRYQLLQKLGNTVTTRSHVYAIWITVGYFEAERVAPSAQHPEGFRYGREVGADTGEIGRHRAFYLFDRSIPVAFQRGQNHNVHRAILIDRTIE